MTDRKLRLVPSPDDARRRSVAPIDEDVAQMLADALRDSPPLDDDEAWARRDAEIAARAAREQADRDRAKFTRRSVELEAGGFPRRALDHAIAPDKTRPLIALESWRLDRHTLVILSGDPGVGKTVAACWWALRASFGAWRFTRATTFASSSRYDRKARDRVFEGALVLDDLGSEYADGAGSLLSDLEELIDTYYASRRPLIITTNLTAAAFKARYVSERIVSRIRECGRWIELGGAPCLRPPPPSAAAAGDR